MNNKLPTLKRIVKKLGQVVVAYSGGVDSTVLLKLALDTLGEKNVLAVTAVSPTYPKDEQHPARHLAKKLGARHIFVRTAELKDRYFYRNPPERCFFCKKELFGRLKEIGRSHGITHILDGTNKDDAGDFRPGERAKRIYKVISPLQAAGFTKKDIRRLARRLKLPNWNKPSLACLASRIPYGQSITEQKLKRIEQAETFLKKSGFHQVRVRDYGTLARIEVEKQDLGRALKKSARIIAELKKLGYLYVTLDLEGFRTGSMNQVLKNHPRGVLFHRGGDHRGGDGGGRE